MGLSKQNFLVTSQSERKRKKKGLVEIIKKRFKKKSKRVSLRQSPDTENFGTEF